MTRVGLLVAAALMAPTLPHSQGPAAATATSPGAGGPSANGPASGDTYEADGRRDPFLALFSAHPGTRGVLKRGDGLAGYAVVEISVRGVMQSRGLLIAMVQGPDKKTYIVHSGDRLADGVVKSVIPQGLVIVKNINDPLSVRKQREVRKLLRSLEDTKE